ATGGSWGGSATVSAKSVPGVGTVLVNGQGQTLYMLTSETGGKITCTQANGCTQAWPETLLSNGATTAKADSGVQSSLLGTVKDASSKDCTRSEEHSLNSSHLGISYAVFCLKKKKNTTS